jgi:hypothetical protein
VLRLSATRSAPAEWCARSRRRVTLAGGASTTLHVCSFARAQTRVGVVALGRPRRLVDWCKAEGVPDAIVGGFFVREDGPPLGELWSAGRRLASRPFDAPWDRLRACVAVDRGAVSLARRDELDAVPGGDLLQAGPLLVRAGESVVAGDPEGFSAGARQFDSDITRGRYPRAALALMADRYLAVASDGRSGADAGLTLEELANALVEFGADAAINLDGGGSTSLVSGFTLMNRPREEHGIELVGGRHVATALTFQRR